MKIQSEKDFYSGVMFTSVGTAFAWGASTYTMGSGARMGAGYFPLILGILLAVLGLAIAAKALVTRTPDGDKIGKFAWQPLFFIISANLVFGACIGGLPAIGLQPLGLVLGIYLLTFIAAKAGSEFKFKEVLIVATILSLMSYVAFILLLKLQFPVWPVAITG